MYAVIFRAQIKNLDPLYSETAEKLRDLALSQFGCLEFYALTEGDREVAISYWPDLESIHIWKQHSEHLVAQQVGRERWYSHYHIQVVNVLKDYHSQPR